MFAIHENKCAHKSNNVPLFSSENQSQFTILQWISHIHILDTFIFLKEVLTIPIQFSNLQDISREVLIRRKIKKDTWTMNNEQWTDSLAQSKHFPWFTSTVTFISARIDCLQMSWTYANSELWKSNNKSDFFCNSLSSDVFFPFKTHVVLINDQWDLWTQKKQTNNCWKTEFVSQIYCAHFPRCQQRVNVE